MTEPCPHRATPEANPMVGAASLFSQLLRQAPSDSVSARSIDHLRESGYDSPWTGRGALGPVRICIVGSLNNHHQPKALPQTWRRTSTMRITPVVACSLVMFLGSSCSTQQLGNVWDAAFNPDTLTEADVSAGLMEALASGITKGADQASKTDGYLKNPLLRIPFPEDIQKVERTLRDIGLDSLVDRFVISLNRAAEDAAVKAKPIFLSAIKSMTFQDAWGILNGEQNAATKYLRRTTSDQLHAAFRPTIEQSLVKVNVTRYYGEIVESYNRIPLVKKVNPDLGDYATKKATDGLFTLIEQEERRIREDPVARTSELLRKVFAAQDPANRQ